MIKNAHKAITDYTEAYKQAKEVHKQTLAYIKDNYKEGSEIYKSSMKTANGIFEEGITPIKTKAQKQVKEEFEALRKEITKTVGALPSQEVLAILPMIKEGKLTETEIQMFLTGNHLNYMDSKLIADATGKPFRTVENIMDNINDIESRVNNFFDTYTGQGMDSISYNNAHILNGAPINLLDEMTNEFLTTYSDQGAGEED